MPNSTVKQLTLVVAIVALASAFAMAQSQASGEGSLTGTVTCEGRITHRYTCQRNQTLQSCTLACVQQGSRFALLVGDKPYLIEGDSHALEAYAGGKATLTGMVAQDRVQVQMVSNTKHNMPGQSDWQPPSMGSNASKSQDSSQPDIR
ncbi:MAG: hypothetical protein ABSD13_15425 [Candidatus Korobacteraceae bacterium]